jgi:hypothetical protein
MHKLSRALSGVLVAVVLAACSDPLTVANRNNPDRIRVLGSPTDLENLTFGAFRTMFVSTIGGSDDNIASQARVMAFENSSSLANFGLSARGAIPRSFIDNSRGNQVSAGNLRDFNGLSRSGRSAADGLNRMAPLSAGGGGMSLGSAKQDARLKAFAWFTLGMSLGRLALIYDSATIINPYDDLSFIPPLSHYSAVMTAALDAMDSALTWTTTAAAAATTGANGFPLPVNWINGNALTATQFTQLVRSYKAQLRADVARTPAARAAVDWTLVRNDAANGITANIVVTTATSPSWTIMLNQIYLYAQWGQASTFIIGMADTSGAYDTWLAAPNANKVPFPVVTADLRFPRGLDRAAQSSLTNSPVVPRDTIQYFRNRSGGDAPSDVYGQSQYDFYRFQPWYNTQRIGSNGPAMLSRNQIDMLQAEALIRLGDFPGAMVLINRYRTRAGLPALVGITARGQPVPGSANGCIPRVPQGPAFTSAACGDIWEAMKWEFRMENMYVGYAAWYFPSRGWGDLPEGTALNWPVPWQEMDTRLLPFYNLGGVGGPDGAVGKGTYGL